MNEQDTIKTSLIGEAATMLARLWKQHLRPVAYERVFYLDGVRVVVKIDEYRTEQDTKPLRRESELDIMKSEMGLDR
jgi:hypothetical protein